MTGPLATAFGDVNVAAGQFIAARLTKFCARVAPAWQLSGLSGCWFDGRAIRFVPAVTTRPLRLSVEHVVSRSRDLKEAKLLLGELA